MNDSRRNQRPLDVERRTPPHNQEAEMAVLGGVLLRNEALDLVAPLLSESAFYTPAHGRIYRAFLAMKKDFTPIDPFTLRDRLRAAGHLDECGGPEYINRLLEEVYTTANIESYAKAILDCFTKRKLLTATMEIQGQIYDSTDKATGEIIPAATIANQAASLIADVAGTNDSRESYTGEDMMDAGLQFIDERMSNPSPVVGVSTGYYDLDKKVGGFQEGDLIYLAARPSMGKSSLALCIAMNVGIVEKRPVALFIYESNQQKVALRMQSAKAKVECTKLKTGTLSDADYSKVADAAALIADAPLFFHFWYKSGLPDIAAICRKTKRERGDLGLVIIDYIQLMETPNKKGSTREREISELSRGLKMLAKELHCPVLALAQLSRALESRPDKHPQLSDLRESGSLEQDADVVFFIYRDVVYHKNCENPCDAEIIVAKNRDGEIGTVKLTFLPWFTRFENHTHSPEAY